MWSNLSLSFSHVENLESPSSVLFIVSSRASPCDLQPSQLNLTPTTHRAHTEKRKIY